MKLLEKLKILTVLRKVDWERLKSRKLWTSILTKALLGALTTILLTAGFEEETIAKVLPWIVSAFGLEQAAYTHSQGKVDAAKQ